MADRSTARAALLSTCALALGALLFTAGCGDHVVDPGDPGDAKTVEVGSGSGAFQELGPGAVVTLVAGGQGGYHVWISVRCSGCAQSGTVSYGIEDADTGELLSFDGLQQGLDMQEDGPYLEQLGMTGFLSGYDPSMYDGLRVRLFATIQGDDGRTFDAEAEATISGTEYYDGNGI
jgi:hypothetical protein